MLFCNQTSLKHAVDKASFGLQQVALLLDCAPEKTNDDLPSSPLTAASLSPMSTISHGDAMWTSAVNTVQVQCVFVVNCFG